MQNQRRNPIRLVPALVAVLLGSVLIGCASGPSRHGTQEGSEAGPVANRSGAEIWRDTCNRCHNYRDPGSYSDAQWDVAMMHMRVRAKLSGTDSRLVLEFLQASN